MTPAEKAARLALIKARARTPQAGSARVPPPSPPKDAGKVPIARPGGPCALQSWSGGRWYTVSEHTTPGDAARSRARARLWPSRIVPR